MRRAPATIVIPVWNAWEHTQRCLESLRPTLGLRDEVVVVDNGSRDATAGELARRSWLTVITNEENRGFAAACNQGAAAATNPVVVFLNNDTLTPSRWLDSLVAVLEDDTVVAAGPRSNAVSGPQLVPQAAYDGSRMADLQRFARDWRQGNKGVTDVERLVGFCLAVKASAFAEVGGFDERFEVGGYEDDDLCLRLRDAGGRLVIAHESFVHHVGHQTFDANDVDWLALQEKNKQILAAKHADEAAAGGVLVSACLIVRDEIEALPSCLAALRGLADEVVVHDTGSVDGTPELAESMGARVIRGEWHDDFAAARNVALDACSGEWILWVDADEVVVTEDAPKLRARLSRSQADGYLVPISNAVGDGSGDASVFNAARVFRRAGSRWAGRVHEQVVRTDGTPIEWGRGLDLRIEHSGYLESVMLGRNKYERNLRLTELVAADLPDDPAAQLNLGRALLVAGRNEEAIAALEKVTSRAGVDRGMLRRAHRAVAHAAIALRQHDQAWQAIESLRALGGAEIAATLLASRYHVATNNPDQALAVLDRLRPGTCDVDGDRLSHSKLADLRAAALYDLNRPSAAADVLLDALRRRRLDTSSLASLVAHLRWSHRSLDEVAALADGEHRMVLLALVGRLSAPAAAELLEALWRKDSDDLSVYAAAAGAAAVLPVEHAVSWSDRLRARGLAEHCPLVAVARSDERTAQDRTLAAALAAALFDDDRGLPLLGRCAVAVPIAERPAFLAQLGQLCPAAEPIVRELYDPARSEPARAYQVSIVLPITADVVGSVTALQALAETTAGADAEVVCVSDGSDPAREQLLAGLDGDVRVLRLPVECGLGQAWNVGLAAAVGATVALVHPQSVLSAGWLPALLAAAGDSAGEGVGAGGGGAVGRLGASRGGPAVLLAAADRLRSVAGADARLEDDAVAADLAARLDACGATLVDVAPALVAWQREPEPPAEPEQLLPLWDRVAGLAETSSGLIVGADSSPEAPRARLHGFFNGEIGLGEGGRSIVESLEAAGVVCATVSHGHHHNRNDHSFAVRPDDGDPYPIQIICLNADHGRFLRSRGLLDQESVYTIGVWAWELEEIPDWMLDGLNDVDEVWLGSSFVRDALARHTRIPVITVPLSVRAHVDRPTVTREEVGLPDGFVFGFAFDHNSTLARKNPDGLVEAFQRAFAPGEGPRLVIKAINGARWPENHARLLAAAGGREDIVILERYLPSHHSEAFTGLVDCWVSLHRSEGFGLTMAEAMAWGTPVVATAYSANLDYMDDRNGWLVPYAPGAVRAGVSTYAEGEFWAEPDLAAAARIMREVWSNPDEARTRGERGRATIAERFSAAAVGEVAAARLRTIQAGLRATEAVPSR